MLDIIQKKGNPEHLDGQVTVYAIMDIDPSDISNTKHPVASMINNGFLVAQGNFREQSSLRDFLKSELGVSGEESLEEGLTVLLEKMGGIESALDPQKLRERLENMGEFEDFIPTPAKIAPFHSEQEIVGQEGDVFFTGYFKNIGNAVLSINAVPILYQARFREQEIQHVRNEIEQLISQIELTDAPKIEGSYGSIDNVEEKILKEFIPNLLYYRKDRKNFSAAEKQFRVFMTGYRYTEDVDILIEIIGNPQELSSRQYKLIELYARKIDAIKHEDFNAADTIRREIEQLREESQG